MRQVESRHLPDANTWHYGYNSAGEVSTAQLKDAANTPVALRDFAWDCDPIGNRTQFRVHATDMVFLWDL